jgi:ribosomal protein L37AE/L43A
MIPPSEKAFLAVRDRLKINPVQQIRVVFEVENEDAPGDKLVAVMRCIGCDEPFVWKPEAGWWECRSCGIELTPDEAGDLVGAVKSALKELNTDVGTKRGGRWLGVLRFLRLSRKGR